MAFPCHDCIVSVENLSVPLVRELLEYQHDMTYVLLNLQRFQEAMLKFAEQDVLTHYLSNLEQIYLNKLTSDKRKREWLGGRFAAKYVAAGMLARNQNAVPWLKLAVIADKNGRPFLAPDKKECDLPDISISHSGELAAAMAVSKGLCGIDIQKVTGRVFKVRDRFCTPSEAHLLSFYCERSAAQSSSLTMLWAAKEALRKVANQSPLPGFLELELTEILEMPAGKIPTSWKLIFAWKHRGINGNPFVEKCSVAVCLIADYVLALTVRNATND